MIVTGWKSIACVILVDELGDRSTEHRARENTHPRTAVAYVGDKHQSVAGNLRVTGVQLMKLSPAAGNLRVLGDEFSQPPARGRRPPVVVARQIVSSTVSKATQSPLV